MKRIYKTQPPAQLTTYKKQVGASYDDIDKSVYNSTLTSLLNEQGWICGYCQQIISESKNATIEHYCEKSICNGQNGTNDLTLDYTNMMAVCLGKGDRETHCDKNKSKFNSFNGLPISVSPWINAHINAINYNNTGTIKSNNPKHDNEIKTILNLNAKYIKKKRGAKFTSFLRNAGTLTSKKGKDKLRRLLTEDMDFGGNRYKNSFPGMSEHMLNKFCS